MCRLSRHLITSLVVVSVAGCGRLGYDPSGQDPADAGGSDPSDAPTPPPQPDARPDARPAIADAGPPDAQNPTLWWDSAWSHRVKLQIFNDPLGEALTNVAIPVFLEEPRIDFSSAASDGADVRFIDDDGVTELDYELELWNPDGMALAWVRIPRIEPGGNEDFFWMYFGNPNVEGGQRPGEVWRDGYVGVWHLNEPIGEDRLDSSVKQNHLTDLGPVGLGDSFLDGAALFQGGYGSTPPLAITDGTQTQLDPDGAFTVEFWINASFSGQDMVPLAKLSSDGVGSYKVYRFADETFAFEVSFGCESLTAVVGVRPLDAGRWHHVVGVYDGARLRLYHDGALEAEQFVGDTLAPCDGDTSFTLGSYSDGGVQYQGLLDEVRVSDKARSAARIEAEFYAMIDQVLAYGPIEDAPVGDAAR